MATVSKVIRVCDRCEQSATTTRNVSLDGKHIQVDVCGKHNAALDRDLEKWTSIGTEIETPFGGFMTPARAAEARRSAESRQREADRARQREERRRAMAEAEKHTRRTVPGAAVWVITNHARIRMEERGFEPAEVLRAAAQPQNTYRSRRNDEEVAIHQLGDCHVVVAIHEKVIITVTDRTSFPKEAEPLTAVR